MSHTLRGRALALLLSLALLLPIALLFPAAPRVFAEDELEETGSGVRLVMPSVFASNMVFQRGKEMPVYGTCAAAGVTVSATLGDETLTATSDERGRFSILFPAREAAHALTLTVSAEGAEAPLVFRNVEIGDVYLLGGQSNMEYALSRAVDRAEYIANAPYVRNIRLFYQTATGSFSPESDVKGGVWSNPALSESALNRFSAIGYIVATELALANPDVTIAMVNAYYAGSSIEAWIDEDTMKDEYPSLWSNRKNFESQFDPEIEDAEKSKRNYASCCYNSMIHPLEGLRFSGVLWYQGESNSGTPSEYPALFADLVSLWREIFCDSELPFYVYQLAPYPSASFTKLRCAQYVTAQEKNVTLIGTNLDGPVFNYEDNAYAFGSPHVHPTRKAEPALRAAKIILAEKYGVGDDKDYAAPKIVSFSASGATATITFDSALHLLWGTAVEGFEIFDGTSWRQASVSFTDDKTIKVTTTGSYTIQKVRYACNTIQVELLDGTRLTTVTKDEIDPGNKVATVTFQSGQKIVFRVGENLPIRSTLGGNLTNLSGAPLPAFMLNSAGTAIVE